MNEKLLTTINQRLQEVYNPLSIYLFGSYAWGVPNKDSDIDLVVVVEKSNKKFYKRAVEGVRVLRGLNIAKDILVYTQDEFISISQDISSLLFKVKNEGVKIYEKS